MSFSLEEIHDRLFEMLCLVDDICTREGITYYLDGGTELGSLREHDLIAWDDDMDIKVMASDYPRFREVLSAHLPDYLRITEPEDLGERFGDFVFRLVDTRDLLREVTQRDEALDNFDNHPDIDIFIVSNASSSKLGRLFQKFKYRVLYGLALGHRPMLDMSEYHGVAKASVLILGCVGRLCSMKGLYRAFRRITFNTDTNKGNYRVSFSGPMMKGRPPFVRAQAFDEVTYGQLRGRNFPVCAGYDEWLTALYGDWKTPVCNKEIYIQHIER